METEISAYICDNSHLASIISLGSTYYPDGHSARSEEFLKWFYLDNPAGPATLIVAHENNVWIGFMALIPVTLEHRGNPQKACFAVNVLTHPEHRNKNLFVKMIKYTRDILTDQDVWLLGNPNAQAFPGWKRQKMTFRNPLHLFLIKFGFFSFSARVRRITNLEQLRELPGSFWRALESRPGIHLKHTPEFTAWRFLNAPHRKYTVSAVENADGLIGLRVSRHFKGPVDLMVDLVAPDFSRRKIFTGVQRPTLLMHAVAGVNSEEVKKRCWKLPVNRTFPFFLTTWKDQSDIDDPIDISLAASDF